MSTKDKISGRLKQAAGDLVGDQKLRRQGLDEERKAGAKQELEEAEADLAHKRDKVARLEYDTSKSRARR